LQPHIYDKLYHILHVIEMKGIGIS